LRMKWPIVSSSVLDAILIYSKEEPCIEPMIGLMLYVGFCSNIARTSVDKEYSDDTVGLPVERATRLHASCYCMLALVGWRCYV